jgi:hypothetical protein
MRASSVLLVVLVGVAMVSPPATAEAQTLIPNPLPILGGGGGDEASRDAGVPCQLGASLICAAGALIGGAGDAVSSAANAAADAVMGGIVDWAASGAAWLLRTIGQQVDRSTRPQLGSAWFSHQYEAMRRLAVALSLAFLLTAITQAAVRHDLRLLVRCCLVALPASLLLMFAAVTLVELALALTDELSAAVLGSADADVREAFSDLSKVFLPSDAATPALPGFLLFLAAVMTSLLALLVWLELVLREAAVYLALAFMPLALAAAVWPRTVHWSQRLAGWLSALILAKLTIATAFSLAGAMVSHARPGSGGLSALMAGCAVLVLAAASPWVLLRVVPFTAAGDGLHRSQLSGAVRQAPGMSVALLLARQGVSHGAGAAAGARSAGGTSGPATWTPARSRAAEPTERQP